MPSFGNTNQGPPPQQGGYGHPQQSAGYQGPPPNYPQQGPQSTANYPPPGYGQHPQEAPQFAHPQQAPRTAPRFTGTDSTGGFANVEQLIGELVMITPVRIDQVQGYTPKGQRPDPNNIVDELTADTVVLTGDKAGDYPSMKWNKSVFVRKGGEILRAGSDEVILGRIIRTPKKAYEQYFSSPDELEAVFDRCARDNTPPPPSTYYYWSMKDATPEDKALAMRYFQGQPAQAPQQQGGQSPQNQDPWGAPPPNQGLPPRGYEPQQQGPPAGQPNESIPPSYDRGWGNPQQDPFRDTPPDPWRR